MDLNVSPVNDRRTELNEKDGSEDAEESESERLELVRFSLRVVETRDRHEEVVLERLLQQLQLEDEHDPEEVEHQVAEDDVVAKRHEIGGVFRLLLLVLVDWMQVHLDELLPERELLGLEKSDLSVAERRLLHPARVPQLVALDLGRLRVFRLVLLDDQRFLLLLLGENRL